MMIRTDPTVWVPCCRVNWEDDLAAETSMADPPKPIWIPPKKLAHNRNLLHVGALAPGASVQEEVSDHEFSPDTNGKQEVR